MPEPEPESASLRGPREDAEAEAKEDGAGSGTGMEDHKVAIATALAMLALACLWNLVKRACCGKKKGAAVPSGAPARAAAPQDTTENPLGDGVVQAVVVSKDPGAAYGPEPEPEPEFAGGAPGATFEMDWGSRRQPQPEPEPEIDVEISDMNQRQSWGGTELGFLPPQAVTHTVHRVGRGTHGIVTKGLLAQPDGSQIQVAIKK